MNEIYVIYTYLSDIYIYKYISCWTIKYIQSMMTVDLAKEKHGIRERFAKVFFFAKNGRFQIKTFRLSIINHIHIYIYILE